MRQHQKYNAMKIEVNSIHNGSSKADQRLIKGRLKVHQTKIKGSSKEDERFLKGRSKED